LTPLLVFLGGGLGAVLRHLATVAAARALGPAFPWGTLGVNAVGGLAMGLLAAWITSRPGTEPARLFLGTGLLGGFTTFSAFSLDALILWERGEAGLAAAYVVGSMALALGGCALGLAIGRSVFA